jgi:hypothetical protein
MLLKHVGKERVSRLAFDELAAVGPIAPSPKTTSERGGASRCPAN